MGVVVAEMHVEKLTVLPTGVISTVDVVQGVVVSPTGTIVVVALV